MSRSLDSALFVVAGGRVDLGVANESDKSPDSLKVFSIDRMGDTGIVSTDRRQTLFSISNPSRFIVFSFGQDLLHSERKEGRKGGNGENL